MARSISNRKKAEDVAAEVEAEQEPLQDIGEEGWDGYDNVKSKSFAEKFSPDGDSVIIHFLEPKPFFTWRQHWVTRKGKRSFACLTEKNGCPLCDSLGDNPAKQTAFNVVVYAEDGTPEHKYWQVGKSYGDTIQKFANDAKTDPLNREDLYFSVSVTEGEKRKNLVMQTVKARDLQEDWDLEALTSDELDAFEAELFDKSIIQIDTPATLREIVSEQKRVAD